MHKATIKVVDPGSVVVRLTVEARASTWVLLENVLSKQMGEKYDHRAAEVLSAIREAIRTVDTNFVGLASDGADQ